MDDLNIKLPYERSPLSLTYEQVKDLSPDKAADIMRLSTKFGVTPTQVAATYDYFKNGVVDDIDWHKIERNNPKTANFLEDPYFMAIAKTRKNIYSLTDIEDSWMSWQDVKEGTKGVIRAAAGFGKGTADYIQELRKNADATFAATHTPEEVETRRTEFGRQGSGEILSDVSNIFGGIADYVAPAPAKQYAKPLQEYTHALVQQAPQLAAQIAIALMSGGTASMLFMGSQIAGSDYLELTDTKNTKKPPVDNARAFTAAIADAAMQAPLERLSLSKTLKRLPAKAGKGAVAREIVESGLTEGLTEWIQKYPKSLAEIWARNPDHSTQQLATEFANNFWETTKAGLFEGAVAAPFGFLGGIGKVTLMKRLAEENVKNDKERQEKLAQMPLLQTSPELVERYLDNVTGGAKIYVEPTALVTLYQSSIAPVEDINEMLGINEKQVEQAAEKGQFVEVSQAKYDIAGAQNPAIREALENDKTDDIDGLTLRQVSQRNERDIKKYGEKAKQQRDEVKAAADEVMQKWKESGAISQEKAQAVMTALLSHARAYSSNPAQFIQEKAPLFQRGIVSPEGAFQQFAGTSAETADRLQLAKAKSMLAAGTDPEAVRKQTGWFQGMEGKMRFEIDDSQAKLIDVDSIKSSLSSEIAGIHAQAKKVKDATAQAELRNKANSLMSELYNTHAPKLEKVLDHPLLYQAYPWIRDMKVIFGTMEEGTKGSYSPGNNTIEINSSLSAEEKLKTLLHEVQHVIQEQEDFARGGSPKGTSIEDYKQYQRLGGEIESRDTASRANLTAEQRKEKAPDLRSDAIISYGGREYSYQQEQMQITPEENIRRGSIAMDRVIAEHTDVLNAMYRPEVGSISFYWGNPGKGPKLKKGGGVSHLIARRNSEGQDGEAVAMKMVEVIAKGSTGDVYGPETGKRVNITYDGYTAVLSLYKAGNIETWLLSGWKNNEEASGAIGEGYGSTDAMLSEPMRTRLEEGADASLTISIPQPGELFQSQNNPRGSIHWNDEGRAIITMFQNADASTVIHELVGHYFVQNLIDEGAKDSAPDWMKRDRTKALEWASSQDVKQELTKLLASAERQNDQDAAARFRDALAFVEAGGSTRDAATDSGHDHHQALRTAYHELLARAAEAYILEGNAPSVETRSLFRRFTEWLIEIYQDIKALGVTLNPEIRGVFDRMLATEEEMSRMVEFEGYLQQLPPGFYNKLSERHKAEVDKLLANVEDKAKEQVRAHLMREFTDQNERLIKEEEQAALERITAEVKAMPRYQAEAVIEERFGRKAKSVAQSYVGHQASPFGATSAADTIAIKRKLLERMIETGDEKGIANLQQEIDALVQKEAAKKANQLQAAEQTEFEFIAEIMHGFTSGDHLAQELIAYNDSETSIRNRLDEHMTAFKKQLTDEEALHQSVEEAMYSDESALLIAAEQRIIDELLGKMIEKDNARLEALRLQEVSRQAAAAEVAGMPLDKVMNLRVWISAERRAAESAQMALAKGDLETAREQKAVQLFNHQMVQESLKARREFERVTNFLKRQKKSGRDTWMSDEISADGTRSATDRHFIQGADLLRRLGFGRSDYTPEENRETLAHYADEMVDENPDMVNLPEWLTKRPDDKIALRSLRLDQLKDIEGALRNIKQMAKAGRDMNSFTTLNGNGVEATALALIDTAAPLPDALVDKIEKEQVSGKEKFLAGLQRPDQLFLKLDHMKEDGPWSKAFYSALSAAQNVKSNLQRQVYEAIDAAYTAAGVSREERQSNAHRQIYIAEWDQSVRKNTLLAMLLNMGSKSNKERLLQSRPVGLDMNLEANWNEQSLRAVLTKYLEPRDFELAQGIWDAIDLLYQPYNTMVRLMTGRPLEKVEPLPIAFTMPDGTTKYLRGGYYPLKQDTRATMQAELNAEKSVMQNFVGMMPYANAGASKSRVAGAKYAVDVDDGIANLWRHITDVTHDIAFRPVMHDINKLLRHDGVRETLRHKLGQGNYDVIIDWYRAIATAKDATVDNLLNQFMTFARTATTIKNLLFRPMTLVQNLANFSLYGNAVRGFSERNAMEAYLKYGWGEYIPHALSNSAKAQEIRAWVYAKSPMMRDKMESPDYTVRDIKETGFDNRLMDSSNEVVYKVGATIAFSQEKVVEFGSKMLAWMDQLTDIPIFRGAYFQAIAQGKSEQEAIRFAESVISRTTGSGRKIDTSLMQRGSTSEKLMTMFLTFLNTQYNRWAMEARIFLSEKDYWRMIQFVGIKYLAFGMLSAVFSGKLPDTEDEYGWFKWFFKEVVMWPMGMIPVGGPLVKVMLDTAIGNKSFGYSITPAEQNLEEIIKLASTAKRYTEGKAQTPELLERGSGVASFFLRYPDQLNDWFWNAYDIISGNMDPEARDLLRRRPRKER